MEPSSSTSSTPLEEAFRFRMATAFGDLNRQQQPNNQMFETTSASSWSQQSGAGFSSAGMGSSHMRNAHDSIADHLASEMENGSKGLR